MKIASRNRRVEKLEVRTREEGAGSVTLLENTNRAGFVSAPRTFARA
jgi:predicted ATPase